MKKITCKSCGGIGASLVRKAGKIKMVPCKPCKGTGKITVKPEKTVKKVKKIKARLVRKPKLERPPKVVAPKPGQVSVVTRDSETGEDVTARMTPEQREARDTIEERAAFFGCPGKVIAVRKGPIITMYEFRPAKTTRLKRLINLQEDLALALSAEAVMVSRIAGRDVMGIEISNDAAERKNVGFRASLVAVKAAKKRGMELPLNLGTDPFGDPIIEDLATMPHLLVAGSTGGGKSVSLNCLISSLVTVCPPQELQFYMIDPKGVELNHYNGIPHMARQVETRPNYAKDLLEDVIEVMRKRMMLLGRKGVRDIREYNALAEGDPDMQKMPRIVVVIDELGDLMMQDRQGFTHMIAEIAQIARASGIHMIVATQRPSVDVLSGKIKVNFPARMAFKVTSATDSKVILSRKGAESLLGRGDMLYQSPNRATVIRIHAPWVPLGDVRAIADRLREIEKIRKEEEERKRREEHERRLAEFHKKNDVGGAVIQDEEEEPDPDSDLDIDIGWTK